MSLPSVAIVIPTRNRHDCLKQCLLRLIPYTIGHPECTIIVSDDGNASETKAVMEGGLGVVQVIQGPRRGPAANRNCGAFNSTEELLIFLDDDCIPDPELIAVYQKAAQECQDVNVFEGRISAQGEESGFADAVLSNESGGNLWSCNFAVRRKTFVRVNGFDERFPFAAMEDIDFHLRVKRFSSVKFLPDARVWHGIEQRRGWRIIKHHTLSVLLYMHVHGLKCTNKSARYFIHAAVRMAIVEGLEHLRVLKLKNPWQLVYRIWASLQLALIVSLWRYHAQLARKFYPSCCPGCDRIHAVLASSESIATSSGVRK
ncbi:MAG: glycosyltransferase [Terracidiphilus sp.]|nr:glycosyltransferase [Terracidiphilus sp.]